MPYAQNLILVNFFWFFGFSFCGLLVVSDRFQGPGGVKTGPGDLLGRVLTNSRPIWPPGDPKMSKKLTELTSIILTSIKF